MTETLLNPVASAVLQRPAGAGRVFFVSQSAGDNDNNGLSPDTPFETLTYALTQCEDWRNDYIYILNSTDGEPLYPVVVAVHAVHIIGVGVTGGAPGMDTTRMSGGGANCMTLTAQRAEIAGLLFTSAAAYGIVGASAYRSWVHHCGFGVGGWPLDSGIRGAPDALGHGLIEDNFFGEGFYGATQVVNGIIDNFTNTTIRRNVFRGLSGVGISINQVEVGAIYDNYFFGWIQDAIAAGWAISLLGAGCQGGIIANNFAAQCGDATGQNPYRDTSTGNIATCLNAWAGNFTGNALSVGPAVA